VAALAAEVGAEEEAVAVELAEAGKFVLILKGE
jgi:hypothetical protein